MTIDTEAIRRRRIEWYRQRQKVEVEVAPIGAGKGKEFDPVAAGFTFLGVLDLNIGRDRPKTSRDPSLIVHVARWLHARRSSFPDPSFRTRDQVATDLTTFLARFEPVRMKLPPVALLVELPDGARRDLPVIDDPLRALTLICRASGPLFLAGREPHVGELVRHTRPVAVYGVAARRG